MHLRSDISKWIQHKMQIIILNDLKQLKLINKQFKFGYETVFIK